MNRLGLIAATAAYIGAIVSANALTTRYGQIPTGPWDLPVPAGTFAAGFALLARDFIQRYAVAAWGRARGIGFIVGCIMVGAALSLLVASSELAVASALAFLAAELVDLAVFTPLRERRGFVAAAMTSNVAAAPVDTVAFLWLAGFPITGPAVAGQFIAKTVWATAAPLTLWVVGSVVARRVRG